MHAVTYTHRARLAAELADRVFEPFEPLADGPGTAPALTLYREAIYWALLALCEYDQSPFGDDPRSMLDGLGRTHVLSAAGDEETFLLVRRALVERSFVEIADDPPVMLRRQAFACRTVVRELLRRLDIQRRGPVSPLLTQRWTRLAVVALLAFVLGGVVTWGVRRGLRPLDFAAGHPWRASSAYRGFSASGDEQIANEEGEVFFHTNEEISPWVEIDLGGEKRISRVGLANRQDCCSERAVPLVVEVSSDDMSWKEVGRRSEVFTHWILRFPPRGARYVRIRSLLRTWLHLEGVSVSGQ